MPNANGTRCFKCGSCEHTNSQCSLERRVCFRCREPGHEMRNCPQRFQQRTCGGCGLKGHISNNCPDRESWICKNCAGSGHGHWECPMPKGYRRKRCHACGGVGHVATNCPVRQPQWGKPKGAKGRGQKQQTCALCGEEGHTRWQCFQVPCSICGEAGHEAISCFSKPEPSQKESERRTTQPSRCSKCDSRQHESRSCPIFQDKANEQSSRSEGKPDKAPAARAKTDNSNASNPNINTNASKPSPNSSQPKPRERTPAEKFRHDKAQSLWHSAEVALLDEEYHRALSLLAEAIALDPAQPEYYATRAFVHTKEREYASALRDFELASTKPTYEPNADTLLRVARCRLCFGSPSSALLAVRDALALNPAHGDALSLRRRVLELEGHMDAYAGAVSRNHWRMARSAYESCLSLYAQEDSDAPGQIRCWGVELLIVEGKWEDTTKSVNVLLREMPNDIDAMTLHAVVLFLEARSPEALSQLVAVLKLDPDNGKAKALRSRVKEVGRLKESGDKAFQKNDYESAIASWTDALLAVGERDDEGRGGILRSILLLDRATAQCKLRNFNEGLKDVNESLKLRPEYHKAFLCRARIMIGLELFETAAEDFRTTLEHGKSMLSSVERRGIQAELDEAEQRAKAEGSKQQDHYAILGLERHCSAVEIKKAFRTMSLKHHPDKGGVAEKFKQIAQAYEILSDPDERRTYDAKLNTPTYTFGTASASSAERSWWDYF